MTPPADPTPACCPRTETVVEKLLTNWMSICLYTFVRVRDARVAVPWGQDSPATWPQPSLSITLSSRACILSPRQHGLSSHQGPNCLLLPQDAVGEPLYMLFRGIKHQVDKGPVDSVTGKAKYTLNDNRLLREDVEYRPLVRGHLVHGASLGGAHTGVSPGELACACQSQS